MATITYSKRQLQNIQIAKTIERWNFRKSMRERNTNLMKKHRYFDIDTPERVNKFLTRRGFSPRDVDEIMGTPDGFSETIDKPTPLRMGLERIIGTNDLLPVYYLNEGLNKARSVGRIWIRNEGNQLEGYGTGSLVSPRLLLTNHHVLPFIEVARTALVEFNYQMSIQGKLEQSEIFTLDPDTFYYTDEHLDYTVVAVQAQNKKGINPGSFGWNPMIEEEGKAIISQWVSIIQHPNGEPKQIGLRENRIVDLFDDFIHYETDTCPGSSGSPLYNDQWEIIGLHHSGVPSTNDAGNYLTIDKKIWTPDMGEDKIDWKTNEGIRISKILKNIKNRNLSPSEAELLNQSNSDPSEKSVIKSFTSGGLQSQPMNQVSFNRGNDGIATWTIPLSISVQLGGGNYGSNGHNGNGVVATITDRNIPANGSTDNASSEEEILKRARIIFREERKDVLKVEFGYKFRNGWITKERCLVVTVDNRKTERELKAENRSRIPQKFESYDVDIVEPSIRELIARKLGRSKSESMLSPVEISAEEIKYFSPAGFSLKEIKEEMRVIAHVSPEKGWENLKSFLGSCKKKLVVAMYDFGAPHILNELKSLNTGNFQEMKFVMQPGSDVGSGTKKNDFKDEDAVIELNNTFGNKFKNAWVNRGRINGWISSSYHIKVAVADGLKIWLSSGNWQSSNQPDVFDATLSRKDQKFLLKNYNREWHVIIENTEIAKTFEGYILHDYKNNKQTLLPDETALLPDVNFVINEPEIVDIDESAIPVKAFEIFDKQRVFKVTPILTPDNYFEIVLDLIKNAKSTLYIQNQTFNAPNEYQDKLKELIDAVIERQKNGVDLKIIFRSLIASETRENINRLSEAGLDVSIVKVHPKCHTKGIMVDGKKVLIGSQNISNDGISVNRDASVLFEDTELTGYFEKIFIHDYAHAVQNIGNESMGLEILEPGAKIPAHKVILSWNEILEMV